VTDPQHANLTLKHFALNTTQQTYLATSSQHAPRP
jgi:hypothetical protein